MYKVKRCWVFIVIACFFFTGSSDFAEGKSKNQSERPPGWDKGEKKGWHSDVPPGLEKEKKEKLKKREKKKKKKAIYKGKDESSRNDKSNDDKSNEKSSLKTLHLF